MRLYNYLRLFCGSVKLRLSSCWSAVKTHVWHFLHLIGKMYIRVFFSWLFSLLLIRHFFYLSLRLPTLWARLRFFLNVGSGFPFVWSGMGYFVKNTLLFSGSSSAFENLTFPGIGGNTLTFYPFSWTGVVAIHRLVLKSNYFLRWETVQKFYPAILDTLNAQLPFYLASDLVRVECFFEQPIFISEGLLRQLDALLLNEFNVFVFKNIEKDPFFLFHLFFEPNLQKVMIEHFLVENVPYVLSQYSTLDYLNKLHFNQQSDIFNSFGATFLADFSWFHNFYLLFCERLGFYFYWETFGSRVFRLGNLPFYSFWSCPSYVVSTSEAFLIFGSILIGGWYFFYSRMDFYAYQPETYRHLMGKEITVSEGSLFTWTYWRPQLLTIVFRRLTSLFNFKLPDNFILFFSSSRLKFRQEFVARASFNSFDVREFDLVIAVFFLFFFVRGFDHFQFVYKKRDFMRVLRKFRKRANRRLESQYQKAISPVLALAEVSESRVWRNKFVPLRKLNDFPLVWRSRLARHFWVPYRARKRLTTTRKVELLLTRYLGKMSRRRLRKRRPRRSRFYRKLRRRTFQSYSGKVRRLRRRLHRRRAVVLRGNGFFRKRKKRWLRLRPRLYGGYLRSGTDQRFDIFTLVDPTDSLLAWTQLQSNTDTSFFFPLAYQFLFDTSNVDKDYWSFFENVYDSGFGPTLVSLTDLKPDVFSPMSLNVSAPGWFAYSSSSKEVDGSIKLFNLFLRQRAQLPFSEIDYFFEDTPLHFLGYSVTPQESFVQSWINFYGRNTRSSVYAADVVYQQRWALANELVTSLFLSELTQDRSRQLLQRSPWVPKKFIRYFTFYSKQLRYNFGFSTVQMPLFLTTQLAAITKRGIAVTIGANKRNQVFLGSPFLSPLTAFFSASRSNLKLLNANFGFVDNRFSRFVRVGWRKKLKPRRFRYWLRGRSRLLRRRKRRVRNKSRYFARKFLRGRSRSWRRLMRHKLAWRITQALRFRRLSYMPDEIQRNRQRGAVYSFLVPHKKRNQSFWFRRKRRIRRLRRLLFTKSGRKLSRYLRRSQERKLFKMLLIRRSARWYRYLRKYGFRSFPSRRKHFRRKPPRHLKRRRGRLFFKPWRYDHKKGILARLVSLPRSIKNAARKLRFGTLSRLRLRYERDHATLLKVLGKRFRKKQRRWKFRKDRAHQVYRGSKLNVVYKKPPRRFTRQKRFKRVMGKDKLHRRRFRWRRSVRRRQLGVRKLRRPYRYGYRFRGQTKRDLSKFYEKLREKHSYMRMTVPKTEKYLNKFGSSTNEEAGIATQLYHSRFFRSPLSNLAFLQGIKNRAVTAFSRRHKKQYFILRRKIRLLHSLPFFRTNRRLLRRWSSFSSPYIIKQRKWHRLLLNDLYQKLKMFPDGFFRSSDVMLPDRPFFQMLPVFIQKVQVVNRTRPKMLPDQRLLTYFSLRFLRATSIGPGAGPLAFTKVRQVVAPKWGALYYSFGQSRGSQYFKIFSPNFSTKQHLPLLWNELALNNRFTLRSYFEDAARSLGIRTAARQAVPPTHIAEFSLQSMFKEFLITRSSMPRSLIFLLRHKTRGLSFRDSGFFGQTYDDRLWHAFPYRLEKDRMRAFRKRIPKRRYLILEFIRKDWYELFNDYCQDWEFLQNVHMGRQSDIIDADFLVRTRGYDPHFKLIKRSEISDLGVLAETFTHNFRLTSLFPTFVSPWRSFFRSRKRIRMLTAVSPTTNHSFSLRRYRRNGLFRLRRFLQLPVFWGKLQRLSVFRSVVRSALQVSGVASYPRLTKFQFRKSKKHRRKMLVFRGGTSFYPLQGLWKMRRKRSQRLVLHIRLRRRRRFGLYAKNLFFRRLRGVRRRHLQKSSFKFRTHRKRSGELSHRRRRRSRRVLRSRLRLQTKHFPIKQKRRQRFFSYRSTRKNSPLLFRTSMFAKTKYFTALQQDLLSPQLLRYVRRNKLLRLFVPSTFLAKRRRHRNRYYRKRYFRKTLYKPKFRKVRNRFRRGHKRHRMRWLRNNAVRYLRRSYLNHNFDSQSRSLLHRGRFRPHQFKIIASEQLPSVSRRATILSVHNFSEYMTPKWRDLFGVMDSFIYYDYRYSKRPARGIDAVSDQVAWLKRNFLEVDEDLLFATGTLTQEFESRIFGHYMRRQQEWDLIPFTIDPKLKRKRARFTWLQRYLSRSLGTRLYRRKKQRRRRKRNRLLWLLFYEQFISNSVVKQNFSQFLRWHRLNRQFHITFRRRKRKTRRRTFRFRRKRHLTNLQSLNFFRFRVRGERKRTDLEHHYFRFHKARRRLGLYKRTRRGLRRKNLGLVSSLLKRRRRRKLKLPSMRYSFWANIRRFQNRLRLGDALQFANFRFYHSRQTIRSAQVLTLKFQLAINLFEYRKFRNRLIGKLRRRPRSIFLGRNSWKTRALWFNADLILFDKPISRGQLLGRSFRRIGGRKRSFRKLRKRRELLYFFRRSAFALNLVRGQREVRQSYLHRYSTRYSLRYRRRMDFPAQEDSFIKGRVKPSGLRQRVTRESAVSDRTFSDIFLQQRLAGWTDFDLGISARLPVFKRKFNRRHSRRFFIQRLGKSSFLPPLSSISLSSSNQRRGRLRHGVLPYKLVPEPAISFWSNLVSFKKSRTLAGFRKFKKLNVRKEQLKLNYRKRLKNILGTSFKKRKNFRSLYWNSQQSPSVLRNVPSLSGLQSSHYRAHWVFYYLAVKKFRASWLLRRRKRNTIKRRLRPARLRFYKVERLIKKIKLRRRLARYSRNWRKINYIQFMLRNRRFRPTMMRRNMIPPRAFFRYRLNLLNRQRHRRMRTEHLLIRNPRRLARSTRYFSKNQVLLRLGSQVGTYKKKDLFWYRMRSRQDRYARIRLKTFLQEFWEKKQAFDDSFYVSLLGKSSAVFNRLVAQNEYRRGWSVLKPLQNYRVRLRRRSVRLFWMVEKWRLRYSIFYNAKQFKLQRMVIGRILAARKRGLQRQKEKKPHRFLLQSEIREGPDGFPIMLKSRLNPLQAKAAGLRRKFVRFPGSNYAPKSGSKKLKNFRKIYRKLFFRTWFNSVVPRPHTYLEVRTNNTFFSEYLRRRFKKKKQPSRQFLERRVVHYVPRLSRKFAPALKKKVLYSVNLERFLMPQNYTSEQLHWLEVCGLTSRPFEQRLSASERRDLERFGLVSRSELDNDSVPERSPKISIARLESFIASPRWLRRRHKAYFYSERSRLLTRRRRRFYRYALRRRLAHRNLYVQDTLFKKRYRQFKVQHYRRLKTLSVQSRIRRRFSVFTRSRRRPVLFQTRHKARNFDWVHRRLNSRYLRDTVYFSGLNNLSQPRQQASMLSATVYPNISTVTVGLEAFGTPELATNYKMSSYPRSASSWLDFYTPRQRRVIAQSSVANGVPLGWAFLLRAGDVITKTGYDSGRWQVFSDLFGGFQGRSSQIFLWLLSGYATGKALLSKELFVAQFLTQTLGFLTGTPLFDFSYVVSYWFTAWWDAISMTFGSQNPSLVLSNTVGLEEPYLLQQYIRRYENMADRLIWFNKLASGVEKMTAITVDQQNIRFYFTPRSLSGRRGFLPSPDSTLVLPPTLVNECFWVEPSLRSVRSATMKPHIRRHRVFPRRSTTADFFTALHPRVLQVDNILVANGLAIQSSKVDLFLKARVSERASRALVFVDSTKFVFCLNFMTFEEKHLSTYLDRELLVRSNNKRSLSGSPLRSYRGIYRYFWHRALLTAVTTGEIREGAFTESELASPVSSPPSSRDSFFMDLLTAIGPESGLNSSPSNSELDGLFGADGPMFALGGALDGDDFASSMYFTNILRSVEPVSAGLYQRRPSQPPTPVLSLGSFESMLSSLSTTPRSTSPVVAREVGGDDDDAFQSITNVLRGRESASAVLSRSQPVVAREVGGDDDDALISYFTTEIRGREQTLEAEPSRPQPSRPQPPTSVLSLGSFESELWSLSTTPRSTSPATTGEVLRGVGGDDDDAFRSITNVLREPAADSFIAISDVPARSEFDGLLPQLHSVVSSIGSQPDVFVETNSLNLYLTTDVVSEFENQNRLDAGLSPRLTHESLRETALYQQRIALITAGQLATARDLLYKDFLNCGIHPDFMPESFGTDNELFMYFLSQSDPVADRLRPFENIINRALRQQLAGHRPRRVRSRSNPEFWLDPRLRDVIIYPSGSGSAGAALRLRVSVAAHRRMCFNVFKEIARSHTSFASWEFYYQNSLACLDDPERFPSWALTPSGEPSLLFKRSVTNCPPFLLNNRWIYFFDGAPRTYYPVLLYRKFYSNPGGGLSVSWQYFRKTIFTPRGWRKKMRALRWRFFENRVPFRRPPFTLMHFMKIQPVQAEPIPKCNWFYPFGIDPIVWLPSGQLLLGSYARFDQPRCLSPLFRSIPMPVLLPARGQAKMVLNHFRRHFPSPIYPGEPSVFAGVAPRLFTILAYKPIYFSTLVDFIFLARLRNNVRSYPLYSVYSRLRFVLPKTRPPVIPALSTKVLKEVKPVIPALSTKVLKEVKRLHLSSERDNASSVSQVANPLDLTITGLSVNSAQFRPTAAMVTSGEALCVQRVVGVSPTVAEDVCERMIREDLPNPMLAYPMLYPDMMAYLGLEFEDDYDEKKQA